MATNSDDNYFSFVANKPKSSSDDRPTIQKGRAPRPFKPADTGKFVREAKIDVSSASESIIVRCLKILGIPGRHDTPPND